MRRNLQALDTISAAVLAIAALAGVLPASLIAKDKSSQVSPNDPTLRLYNLLDSKFNGKLSDLYVLAEVYNDPKIPSQPQQHVIHLDYSKDRAFGKLSIHVRTVGQLSPEQLKAYTPKQIYDFAEGDSSKFTKTDPGSFGKLGDVYFEVGSDGGALAPVTATPEIQAAYDRYLTQYILPELEKKAAAPNP